jgi:hypothetical protein
VIGNPANAFLLNAIVEKAGDLLCTRHRKHPHKVEELQWALGDDVIAVEFGRIHDIPCLNSRLFKYLSASDELLDSVMMHSPSVRAQSRTYKPPILEDAA